MLRGEDQMDIFEGVQTLVLAVGRFKGTWEFLLN